MRRWRFGRANRPRDDEIERELRDHLELEAEALAAHGLGADAAFAARRRFGNVALVRESVREIWRWSWLEQLGQDIRHGWRGLLRSPFYAITATVTLALGIGATVAVFSLSDPILNRPFPLLPQERLLWIVRRSKQCPTCDNASPAAFFALRARAGSMAALAATARWGATVRGTSGSDLVDGFHVSSNLFSMISAPFALGRGFDSDADRAGNDAVTVLSYEYWQERFRGSRDVLDSTIVIDGRMHRIVGVLARDVVFPMYSAVYAPLVFSASAANDHVSRYIDVFARLAPRSTLADAQREADVISKQLATDFPKTDGDWMLVPRPLESFHTDDAVLLVAILGVAVALVLLAGCVSVANLTLARTMARRRELALRAALGGRRGRLARHLLAEALIVALAGGAIGVVLATWGVKEIHGAIPASMARFVPGWALVRISLRSLVFTLLASVGTTAVFALLPTVRATRVELASVLSDGGRGSAGGVHGTRLRASLVVLEVSVALVLLTGAALLGTSVRNMVNGKPGVRLDNVLTMTLTIPPNASDSGARDFVGRLDARLHALRAVRSAGLVSTTPLSNNWWGTAFTIPGRAPLRIGEELTANDQRVTPDYFQTMGIRVLDGRGIDRRDVPAAQRVAVINHYMAEKFWPGVDPIGRIVTIGSIPWTIVGVAADVRHGGFDEEMRAEIYRSYVQAIAHSSDLAVWTDGDPNAMREAVRQAVAATDPAAAVGRVMTMREMEARHVSPFRLMAWLVSIFAGITVVIAVVGLYGVIAYGVAQRTREIGVRIALGASNRDILSNVAGGAVRLTSIGVAIGGVGAFAFAQLLRSVLYGVTASDPRTPVLVGGALLCTALVAALVPAWRASRVNPAVALRE